MLVFCQPVRRELVQDPVGHVAPGKLDPADYFHLHYDNEHDHALYRPLGHAHHQASVDDGPGGTRDHVHFHCAVHEHGANPSYRVFHAGNRLELVAERGQLHALELRHLGHNPQPEWLRDAHLQFLEGPSDRTLLRCRPRRLQQPLGRPPPDGLRVGPLELVPLSGHLLLHVFALYAGSSDGRIIWTGLHVAGREALTRVLLAEGRLRT